MVNTTRAIDEMYYGPGGGLYQVVATPEQTGNIHFAFVATGPPGGGPPLHIQTRHEELFFVLEGETSFWLDGRVIRHNAGGTAFVPRGMPHCFKNCSDKRARVLILFTPGDIEVFFDYGMPLPDASVPSDEVLMEKIANWARVSELSCSARRRCSDRDSRK